MQTSSDMFYTVRIGAVFKLRFNGKPTVAISERLAPGKWSNAWAIKDEGNVYKNLNADQVVLVTVETRGEEGAPNREFRAVDQLTITLDHQGDSTTVAKAVKDKALGGILDAAIAEWFKQVGPIRNFYDDTPTILSLDMLKARYPAEKIEAFKEAWKRETLEASGVDDDAYKRLVARFDAFMANYQDGDGLYWFEYRAPRADRIGYAILRDMKLVAAKVEIMT